MSATIDAVRSATAAPAAVVTAPGGWRRATIAFAMGIVAGAAVALVLPRDDAPRRR